MWNKQIKCNEENIILTNSISFLSWSFDIKAGANHFSWNWKQKIDSVDIVIEYNQIAKMYYFKGCSKDLVKHVMSKNSQTRISG